MRSVIADNDTRVLRGTKRNETKRKGRSAKRGGGGLCSRNEWLSKFVSVGY